MERRTFVAIGISVGIVILIGGIIFAVVLRRRATESTNPLPNQNVINSPVGVDGKDNGPTTATPKVTPPLGEDGKPLEMVRVPGGAETFVGTPASEPPSGPDRDSDGLTNEEEAKYGTDPDKPDTDGDGINDGPEVQKYKTDPLKVDSDGNGIPDGQQVRMPK